jgi:glycerol-3-phosphate cytidylyltransferase-like family protein
MTCVHRTCGFSTAAKLGDLTVLLSPDKTLQRLTGKLPKFPLPERLYLSNVVRNVTRVIPLPAPMDFTKLPKLDDFQPQLWVNEENEIKAARNAYSRQHGLEYRVLPASRMLGFTESPPISA